jgi:hypothetical protein
MDDCQALELAYSFIGLRIGQEWDQLALVSISHFQ